MWLVLHPLRANSHLGLPFCQLIDRVLETTSGEVDWDIFREGSAPPAVTQRHRGWNALVLRSRHCTTPVTAHSSHVRSEIPLHVNCLYPVLTQTLKDIRRNIIAAVYAASKTPERLLGEKKDRSASTSRHTFKNI